jgi:hypothetical protein
MGSYRVTPAKAARNHRQKTKKKAAGVDNTQNLRLPTLVT